MHVDFGTGDGALVLRRARADRSTLFVGVDAVADGLRASARAAERKPARGGVSNALFGRLALEQAPGELSALADSLGVILPWGSLLRALALPEPDSLARLLAIGKPGAELCAVLGYSAAADPGTHALGLPALDAHALGECYARLGHRATIRSVSAKELASLGTTWAGKLAFSGKQRELVELRVAVPR